MGMRLIGILLLACFVSSCSVFENDARHGIAQGKGYSTPTSYTTADIRIITERVHPVLKNTIVCAEPSPDVAKALSTAAGITASGGSGTAKASLGVSESSAEALAELAGRSTALLALRDALFRACEAYANGAIGQNAYALAISRYDQETTTLFLGQDITGAASAGGKAQVSSAALQALGAQQANASGQAKGTPSTVTTTKTQTAAQPSSFLQPVEVQPDTAVARLVSDADQVLKPVEIKQAAGTVVKESTPPSASAKGAGSADSQTPTSTNVPPSAAVSATAALALARMNEDYIHQNAVGPLIVACVEEYDPTRMHLEDRPSSANVTRNNVPPRFGDQLTNPFQGNPFLEKLCAVIASMNATELETFLSLPAKNDNPIQPEAGMTTPKGAAPATKPEAAPKNATDTIIAAVQKILSHTYDYAVAVDGVDGPATRKAVKAYQNANPPLPVNGDPKDPALLKRLQVQTSYNVTPSAAKVDRL
jgi:hypothetical protein